MSIGPGALPGDGYWRRVAVTSVHDGDTLHVSVDLGFGAQISLRLRLSKVNCPELPTEAGRAAQRYAAEWIVAHSGHTLGVMSARYPLLVHYDGWDNFGGRFDGVLVCSANHCLNDAMIASGNAVPYP